MSLDSSDEDQANLFVTFNNYASDDSQSDISLHLDVEKSEMKAFSYSDGNEDRDYYSSFINTDWCDMRKPTLPHSGNGAASPTNSWSFDCSQAGVVTQPFIGTPGPTKMFDVDADPIENFYQLIPSEFFQTLADETNRYAKQQGNIWSYPTCIDEIKAFVAIHIFMGIVRMPNSQLYWSNDMNFNQIFVSNLMSRNRFSELLANFHLADSSLNSPCGAEGHNPLHKVEPIVKIVKQTWAENYSPHQNVSIGEAKITFKGRCPFKEYRPSNPIKWGLKVWAICDSETYYMLDVLVHTGRRNDVDHNDLSLGERVVRKLAKPYTGHRHVLYIDDFFTSLPLVKYLLDKDTYCCGMVRTNKKDLPREIKDPKTVVKPGETVRMYADNVLAIAGFDQQKSILLSSAHSSRDHMIHQRRNHKDQCQLIPEAVHEYSTYCSGVDKNDQLRSSYGISNNVSKWWKYLMWFFIDVSLINSYILYRDAVGGPRKKPMTQLEFNMSVMKGLAGTFTSRQRGARPTGKRPAEHTMEKVATKRGQRDCAHCKAQGIKTKSGHAIQATFQCIACNKGLCKDCFDPFHGN